jgi:rod shape-determining protein MreC
VTAVAIILLVIIGMTNTERVSISKFEKVVGSAISPVNKLSFSIGEKTSGFFYTITNLSKTLKENEDLEEEIKILKEENRNLQNIIGKTDYLKREADLIKNTRLNLIDAQVTSKEPGNWYDRFIIDKGIKHGIKKGQTVVQGIEGEKGEIVEGIIGRVVDVGPNWAKIISIIDELNSTSFKIIRTQDGGVISGSTDGILNGYLFDYKADIIVGDKLYTSGLGENFVKDIYIGEVEEVIKDI